MQKNDDFFQCKKSIFALPILTATVKTNRNRDNRRLLGYIAGIVAGVSYGTNPLFGKALIESGVPLTPKMFCGIAVCVAAVVFMILKPGSSKQK